MRCSSSLIVLAFLSISVPLMDWGAWHWDEALQVLWGPYPIQQQPQTFPSLLFAVNVLLLDVCLVFFDASHWTHIQVGFGFPNHVLLGLCLSVPFSFCHCIHCLYVSLLMFWNIFSFTPGYLSLSMVIIFALLTLDIDTASVLWCPMFFFWCDIQSYISDCMFPF